MNSQINVRPVIIGNFGPPTLTCLRSWNAQGFTVGMVCIRKGSESLPRFKYLKSHIGVSQNSLFEESGIKKIVNFVKQFDATGIICIDEKIALWLQQNKSRFPDSVAFWMPVQNTIKEVLSKRKQISIARRVGLKVLTTHSLRRKENYSSIPAEHFPLCLRPSLPNSVDPPFKVKLVYNPNELDSFLDQLQKVEESVIGQPFKSLPNLVVHGARTLDGETIGLQGFVVERKFEGLTLTIRPFILPPGLGEKCIAFTDEFNLTGNYHFEFLIDLSNDDIYFLEINNRLGGTTAKVFKCGYDEPLLALQAYGIHGTSRKKIQRVCASSKQALLKYLVYSIQGKLTDLDYPSEPYFVRIFKTLWALLIYKDDVFSFTDIKGSLRFYLGNLRTKVK